MGDNGYKYHVFLSYKRARKEKGRVRDAAVETWVKMFFEDELQNKLTDALDEPAEIFFDQFDIRSGDKWKQSIAEALSCSLCIVPVWSTLYFTSPWCLSEWATFHTTMRPVVPVLWHAEMALPPGAAGTQGTDFSTFTYTTESFGSSPDFMGFQKHVRDFASDVAAAIDGAPDYDPSRRIVLPEPPSTPRPANVVLFDELDDKAELVPRTRSRLNRRSVVLAA